MFELANKLVGVYKTYDATKTIAIIPELINQKIADLNKDRTEEAEDNEDNIWRRRRKAIRSSNNLGIETMKIFS